MIPVPAWARRVLPSWGALVLILLVTGVAYRGVIHNGFVLDDFALVAENRLLDSFGHAAEWLRFRPVTMASYALERMLWGESATGHHVGNLLVHAAVVVLTGVLARRLWRDPVAAVAAAAIVALHPINSETVNYIVARSSSLMTLWILVSVWCYECAWRHTSRVSRVGWLAGSAVAGLAAIGAKEAGVVLPLLIVCWDRAVDSSRPWTTTLVRSTPFWAVVVGLLGFRAWMLGAAVGITPIGSTFQAIAFDAKIMLVSFGHWWWPMNLAIDYAWPNVLTTEEATLWMVGAVAAVMGTWVLVWRGLRVGWWLVWFWISLLPMFALPFVTRLAVYQEHRSYLGGVAMAWAIGGAASSIWWFLGGFRIARAACIVSVMGLVAAAVWFDAARTSVWRDVERVWSDSLAKYPNSTLGHNAMAAWLADAGDLDAARKALDRSLAVNPLRPRTHGLLGALYGQMGRYEDAVTELTIALRLAPTDLDAWMNLGKAYEGMGQPDRALEVYDRLLRDDPRYAPALGRSGVVLERAGRFAEAVDRYRAVVAIDPEDDTAREALGAVLLRLERWGEAEDVFATLVSRHPDSGASWFNLRVARERLGRDHEALEANGVKP